MIEFLEDLIEKDPSAEFPRMQVEDGTYVQRTGDTVVDTWSQAIAEGKPADLLSVFSADDRQRIAKFSKRVTPSSSPPSAPSPDIDEDFHDDYTKDMSHGNQR